MPARPTPRPSRRGFLFFASALATAWVYRPVLRHDFVNWDDIPVLFANPLIVKFDWAHVKAMLSSFYPDTYSPLCWLFIAAVHSGAGMAPAAFHAVSLILHALTAAALCWVALELFRAAKPGLPTGTACAALFASLYFSLHPVQSEMVAGAAYLTDLPACLFALAAVGAYASSLSAADGARGAWKDFSVALAFCSALWRWQGIAVPIVLLALDYYPYRRLSFSSVQEKIPYFAISAATLVLHSLAKKQSFGYTLTIGSNLGIAARGLMFYPMSWLLPGERVPVYVFSGPLASGLAAPVAVIAAAGATAAAYLARRRWPALWISWICYVASIAPALSFTGASSGVPVYGHDRHAYFAGMSFALFAGAALLLLWEKWIARRAWILASAAVLLALLSGGARAQLSVWRDSESLWLHALRAEPSSPIANYRIVHYYVTTRRPCLAADFLRAHVQAHPDVDKTIRSRLPLMEGLCAQSRARPVP